MKLSVISDQLSASEVQWRRKAGSTETTQSDSKSRSEKQIPRVARDDKTRRRGMRVERDQAAFDSERVIHHRGHREHRGTRVQRKGEAPASASEGGRYTDQLKNDARAARRKKRVGRRRTTRAIQESGGGFWTENALETRAGELDADDAFAIGERLGDVDDATLSLKFGVGAASGVVL
jgi:hypothetical protein